MLLQQQRRECQCNEYHGMENDVDNLSLFENTKCERLSTGSPVCVLRDGVKRVSRRPSLRGSITSVPPAHCSSRVTWKRLVKLPLSILANLSTANASVLGRTEGSKITLYLSHKWQSTCSMCSWKGNFLPSAVKHWGQSFAIWIAGHPLGGGSLTHKSTPALHPICLDHTIHHFRGDYARWGGGRPAPSLFSQVTLQSLRMVDVAGGPPPKNAVPQCRPRATASRRPEGLGVKPVCRRHCITKQRRLSRLLSVDGSSQACRCWDKTNRWWMPRLSRASCRMDSDTAWEIRRSWNTRCSEHRGNMLKCLLVIFDPNQMESGNTKAWKGMICNRATR